MPGIKEVAARAGVSVSTVSYVMSGKRSVSGETKLKVMQAARELGYHARGETHAVRGERAGVIAMSSPIDDDTDYMYWAPFCFAIAKQARKRGYDVLVMTEGTASTDIMRMADSGAVDGVVLLDVSLEDPRAADARISRVPVVSIGCPREVGGLVAIDLDFERMGRKAIDVLRRFGHRHVLFVGSPVAAYLSQVNFLVRTRDAIMARARAVGVEVTFVTMRDGGTEDVTRIVESAFEQDPQITAVIGQCDVTALSNLASLLQFQGKDVPRDISMLMLGSFGHASAMGEKIDEIPMQPYSTCNRAVDVLVDLIEGRRRRRPEGDVELMPVSYLRRGSVARAKGTEG